MRFKTGVTTTSPTYPVILPVASDHGRSKGTCSVDTGAGELDTGKVGKSNGQTDGQSSGVFRIRAVLVTNAYDDDEEQEAEEELDGQALQWQ